MEDGQTGLKITLNVQGLVREAYSTEQDNATTLCKLNRCCLQKVIAFYLSSCRYTIQEATVQCVFRYVRSFPKEKKSNKVVLDELSVTTIISNGQMCLNYSTS